MLSMSPSPIARFETLKAVLARFRIHRHWIILKIAESIFKVKKKYILQQWRFVKNYHFLRFFFLKKATFYLQLSLYLEFYFNIEIAVVLKYLMSFSDEKYNHLGRK